jgi:hypothetical protein
MLQLNSGDPDVIARELDHSNCELEDMPRQMTRADIRRRVARIPGWASSWKYIEINSPSNQSLS